jgi:predicted outer membrane repeat protein
MIIGGAIGISRAQSGSTVLLTGLTSYGNKGEYGGSIFIRDISSSLPSAAIQTSSFTSNSATRFGGSIFAVSSLVGITGCSFTTCNSIGGGAIYYEDSTVTLTSPTYTNNIASGWGNDVATLPTLLVASSQPVAYQTSGKSFTPPLVVELRDALNQRVVPLSPLIGSVSALNATIAGYLGIVSKSSDAVTGRVTFDIAMTGSHIPNQQSLISVDYTTFTQVRQTFTTNVGVTLRQCVAGEYNLAQVCSMCETGRFSNDTATAESSSCTLCPVGTYNSLTNQTVCTACAAGTYSGKSFSFSLSFCWSHLLTFLLFCQSIIECTAAAGSSICTSCALGKYALNTGSLECTSCESGESLVLFAHSFSD